MSAPAETAVYAIEGGDYDRGGLASKQLKEMLKRIGADPKTVRRTMVAAYEAEMNVVIHAHKGTMRVGVAPAQVDVVVADEGPGIPDIERAMAEGFSTAPARARELGFGAGMGLPNIRKNSDRFSIQSAVGQGTNVRFSVFLQPQTAGAAASNSVHIDATRCRRCLLCLSVCPTRAMRVRALEPTILDHLCVDCTACIAACESGALTVNAETELPVPDPDTVLVLPASFLEQFGPNVTGQDVLDTLRGLGFGTIRLSDEWEKALRTEVLRYAAQDVPGRPVLSPVCPAVVNLVQTRFPSLIGQLAPFLTPLEAAREELAVRHALFVVVCPSQHTILRSPSVLTRIDAVMPSVLRHVVQPKLTGAKRPAREPVVGEGPVAEPPKGVLQVSGMRHVVQVLEEVENGQMDDALVIELYACNQQCFGSPLWREDPFVARSRYERERIEGRELVKPGPASVIRRTVPPSVRAGLRLDADMRKAIEKLARIDGLAKALPGRNCGVCGAPTCASLAEDAVLGRGAIEDCPYRTPTGATKEDAT